MRFLMFYHSLVSDWNHGNAHFLRGVATELTSRGHQVRVLEPRDSWSVQNLLQNHGRAPVRQFHALYPQLRVRRYRPESIPLERELEGADVVIVHEWNPPSLVRQIGALRRRSNFRLFFHDTHHRMITAPSAMADYELEDYDGVLAYGRVLQDMYLASGRVQRAWTWHEAADTRVFRPVPATSLHGEVVWIGNWGDDERAAELREFLFEPVRDLALRARVYGVRYPDEARAALREAGIAYGGWLPNFRVPEVFARFLCTVHIPRRPYVRALPGIPTIRPFEALACGIPLISSPWPDAEHLFRPGTDFLVARNGGEMRRHLKDVLENQALATSLASNGLATIRRRHTCAHRVDELLAIIAGLEGGRKTEPASGVAMSPQRGFTPSSAPPVLQHNSG